jgi:hypothetical protein
VGNKLSVSVITDCSDYTLKVLRDEIVGVSRKNERRIKILEKC